MHADADCNENRLGTSQHLLSGIEAGVIMVFFTNPIWLLKTRLQLQGSQKIANVKQYNGPVGMFVRDAMTTRYRDQSYPLQLFIRRNQNNIQGGGCDGIL